MKKLLATVSVFSILSLSAVPAFAADNNGTGNIHIKGNHNQIKIDNNTKVENNFNINLVDIGGHWAEKYIKDLVSKGVLQGDENHNFNPDQHVTREQFAAMVARMFNLKNTSTVQDFNDVPQKRWSFSVVEATKDYFDAFKDLNGGYDFHPAEGAQRQDVTVTLVKVLLKLNPTIQLMDAGSADQLLHSKFKDADNIASVLRPYVATAVQNNLIQGDDQGRFNPDRTLTRAESAALLDRISDMNIVVSVPSGSTTVSGSTYGDSSVTGSTYGK
ncbi:S-layer homology domain-containing protein [Paenibacillus filicis]|uniref:S-layer homology domain-containing protein n=1 Tax=Paenibacillus gyeongsangnamensis TaxID=3388067 RepID=A0ABT4QIL8_9BACL|nr:S-layer homology domain-containing protein [Paenibacillus filicis]MCZ8516714.1 S-layer homology domain-containing protein [Paenibacillus filicis]